MWQINSNFGAFNVEKWAGTKKAARAAPNYFLRQQLQNFNARPDADLWNSKKDNQQKDIFHSLL